MAELDLAPLQDKVLAILRDGDPINARRSELANELGKKGAAERYAAFLELVPSLIAQEALTGSGGRRALGAGRLRQCRRARRNRAPTVAGPGATIFQIGGSSPGSLSAEDAPVSAGHGRALPPDHRHQLPERAAHIGHAYEAIAATP